MKELPLEPGSVTDFKDNMASRKSIPVHSIHLRLYSLGTTGNLSDFADGPVNHKAKGREGESPLSN